MPYGPRVALSPAELELADDIGRTRYQNNRKWAKAQHGYFNDKPDSVGVNMDVIGAAAEIAARRFLGASWLRIATEVNENDAGDGFYDLVDHCGIRWGVRGTGYMRGHLCLYEKDLLLTPSMPIILVTVDLNQGFGVLRGWITPKEGCVFAYESKARQLGWVDGYAVPQEMLNPMSHAPSGHGMED